MMDSRKAPTSSCAPRQHQPFCGMLNMGYSASASRTAPSVTPIALWKVATKSGFVRHLRLRAQARIAVMILHAPPDDVPNIYAALTPFRNERRARSALR
jgi:hypothetical protein